MAGKYVGVRKLLGGGMKRGKLWDDYCCGGCYGDYGIVKRLV